MIATSTTIHTSVLSDELLIRCHERVPQYDRENRFAQEDFDELHAAGYFRLAIPAAFGGLGMSLCDVVREQRRLAYFAAPTAEAVAMHFAWIGVAAQLWHQGDRSLEWVLDEASQGRIFTAGHAESGHDVPLTSSTTRAERVHGGYRVTGHKSFGALGPVWDYMGLHALDETDVTAPQIVHVFMPRNTEGYARRDGTESLGMRATRRDETLLDGAFIPDRFIARTVAAGAAGHDAFVVTLMAWQLLGFAAISVGMARRAVDLTMEALRKTTHAASRRALAHDPGAQQRVAEMGLELEAIEPHLNQIAADWSGGVAHGARWPMKLLAAKHHAAEGAWRVIDTALDLAGSAGVSRRAGLEQLFRDARLSRVYPGHALYVHDVVGRTMLGLE